MLLHLSLQALIFKVLYHSKTKTMLLHSNLNAFGR